MDDDPFSDEDGEIVSSKVADVARVLKERHPKKNFHEIRHYVHERVDVTI